MDSNFKRYITHRSQDGQFLNFYDIQSKTTVLQVKGALRLLYIDHGSYQQPIGRSTCVFETKNNIFLASIKLPTASQGDFPILVDLETPYSIRNYFSVSRHTIFGDFDPDKHNYVLQKWSTGNEKGFIVSFNHVA